MQEKGFDNFNDRSKRWYKKLDLFFSFRLVIFSYFSKNKVIKKAASELPETALYIGLKLLIRSKQSIKLVPSGSVT